MPLIGRPVCMRLLAGGVFVDDLVMHRAHSRDPIHERRKIVQVFADLNAGNGRIDRFVIRAWRFLGWVALPFGIERVDLTHSAAQPDRDYVLRFAGETGRIVCGEDFG